MVAIGQKFKNFLNYYEFLTFHNDNKDFHIYNRKSARKIQKERDDY